VSAEEALAFIFARATRNQLIAQLEYLKIENQILRGKLPKRIRITPGERARLLKFGKPLGSAIRQLISIVHPRTFARWKSEERDGRRRGRHKEDGSKGGRPRKSQFIRDLVVRMARENDWGLTRIAAEIRQLYVGPIGRTTVRNILNEDGVDRGPERGAVPWGDFIARHAATLWSCDFLSVRTWTMRGRIDLYLLVFIHVASRRVFVSPATVSPGADWTEQQARNFAMHVAESELECAMVLHDRDAKFTRAFDVILNDSGATAKKLPPCSPNLNAFAERFVRTLKHECLNHFIVFGERHLDHLVDEFVDHYHTARPHQGIDNRTPMRPRDGPGAGPVRCDSRLGGVLKRYYRAAA
jgi:putative transposase